MRTFLVVLAALLCAAPFLYSFPPPSAPRNTVQGAAPEAVDAVLARMDKESAGFRDLSAQLTKTTYTAVLNDTSRESGQVWMKRAGRREMVMRVEFTGTNPRAMGFQDSKGQIYYPKINTVQVYDLGKTRSLVDQFLLLGFGTSGKELAKNYAIKLVGQEAVAGRQCSRLQLTPKSEEIKKHVTEVGLWIPLDAGYPIQQRFLQPGGDFILFTYSDLRINPALPDSAFRLNVPKDAKVEYPQK